MEKMTVERSIWINAPREQVWEALTNPDQIMQWLVPNLPGVPMKRDDDGKLTVHLGEMGVDFAVLKIAAPARQVTISGLPDGRITTTYNLNDKEGGTDVTVSMIGFEALPDDSRDDRLRLGGSGWEKALQNLKAYVDGSDLPFPHLFVGPLFGYWREIQKKIGVERSIWINGSREKVWKAITDPKQIQQWYSPNTAWNLSALEVGGKIFATNPENKAEMYVEIIQVLDPPHQLATRNVPEPPDTIVKDKTYLLTEENGGTRLTLILTGYELESKETRWNQMEENAFGFAMMLQNAKAYVEGRDLPFPWGF